MGLLVLRGCLKCFPLSVENLGEFSRDSLAKLFQIICFFSSIKLLA